MKKTKTSAATPAPPPEIDYSQFEATGFERTSTEDLGIPFLVIVQKGSPEVDRSHKDYATKKIVGANVGDIINTVTREVVHVVEQEPAIFVPCNYERLFVEWKNRDAGGAGGFIRSHSTSAVLDECSRNDRNQDVLPNGNLIVTTGYFFGHLLFPDGDIKGKAIIAMSSTQLKKARMWLNMMQSLKVNLPDGTSRLMPMFSHKYALTTVPEQNNSGSWMGWHIEGAGKVTDLPLLKECADVAKKFNSPSRPQIADTSRQEDNVM